MDPYKNRPSSAFNSPFWTTNSGAPIWNNNSSLTVGSRGPILLEDYHLVEKLANFDREWILERVVHARGASAKGFFEVTHDISHLSCADFLRAPGIQTPVITRFSTVIHERGSPETLRDPRGFAVKFYTREGNFDLVGDNFPVFFVRDGMKFPDMVHALKPNPKSRIQENWRILDFFSHHPESLHMFSFLFDDVGVPQDYRHMDGFGVNTYTLINKAGKAHYVKFHWKPTCGVKCLLEEEAIKVGGSNHSHATQDLYDSIAAGNYPEWKLYIQTIDPDHEDRFDFDPLDVTKIWPDKWVGPDALSFTFHRLYNISLMKEAKIDQMGTWSDGQWCWKFTWRRRLFVWEDELLGSMLEILNQISVKANVEDSWCWMGNCSHPYAVNKAYKVITALEGVIERDIYRIMWETSVPLKVAAFCWRSIQDRVPTAVNLFNRGITTDSGTLLCCFCVQELETCNHLFLSCKFSYYVWLFIYNWMGIYTVLAGDLKGLLLQHNGLFYTKGYNNGWRMFWFATIWSLWLHRNDIIFNQAVLDFEKVIELIKVRVWSWCKASVKRNSFSFTDWCLNPSYCLQSIG